MDEFLIIESMLYIAGNDGVLLKDIQKELNKDEEVCKCIINDLNQKYSLDPYTIFTITETKGIYRLATKPSIYDKIKPIITNTNKQMLSTSALEVLSIIAYQQPITRIEIDQIRGVNSSSILAKMVDQKLIEVVGVKDTIGKPKLYATTNLFLNYFGLASLDELPEISEMIQTTSEDLMETFNRKLNKD